ncbi:MAG: putative rRNA maturation factor [Nitrospirae bacterium]|nr:putative rRNA maturation factor [Nitrospirota bacterium]
MEKDLTKVLLHLHLQRSELSVLFVNSRRMKILNTRYRRVPKDTDVLSFPLRGEDLYHDPVMLGDIVISAPKALQQSKEFQIPFHDELLRLLVHGLLHLIGYDHERNTYQKKKMEKKERELLDAIKKVA